MVIAASALNFQPKQATLAVNSFLQRLLLITDGSVSDIIQTYSGEKVSAVKLQQKLVISGSRFSKLRLEREYQLLNRSIIFQGEETKASYLYADAQIVLERLNADIRDELVFGCQSISKLLNNYKIATYREILDCGVELAGSLAQYFEIQPYAEIIYRTYLILIDGLPIIQITEKFPASYFVD